MKPIDNEFKHTLDQSTNTLQCVWAKRLSDNAEKTEQHNPGVYQSGPKKILLGKIIRDIDNATQMIIVSTFLFAQNELARALAYASERGVKVYLMMASESRIESDPDEGSDFDKKVIKYHKDLLQQLSGKILIRSASHYHSKCVLIDPHSNPKGYLLTANLADKPLFISEEIGIELTEEEVAECFEILRWGFWEDAEHEIKEKGGRFQTAKKYGELSIPQTERVYYTTNSGSTIKNKISQLIEDADKEIFISNFGWDPDQPIIRQLLKKADTGTKITLLTRIRQKTKDTIDILKHDNILVLGFKNLHAKAIWTDQERAFVTSANFQKEGLDTGFELGVELFGERADAIKAIMQEWIDLKNWEYFHEISLGNLPEMIGKIEKDFTEYSVKSTDTVSIGIINLSSIEDLGFYKPKISDSGQITGFADPKKKVDISGYWLTKQLEITWEEALPILDKKAKEIVSDSKDSEQDQKTETKGPDFPKIFKELNGRRVVAIRSLDELELAKTVKQEKGLDAIVLQSSV